MTCPVFAAFGGRDLQVPAAINRTRLEAARGIERDEEAHPPRLQHRKKPERVAIRRSVTSESRTYVRIVSYAGGLAMLIATIGLYGVMSYTVARRKVEIGLRMALGADPGTVVRMVIGESGRLLLWGVACGIGLAVLSSRWAASLLFGLKPWDPASLVTAVAVLSAVSLLAAWLPARRASRLTPTIALRDE